MVKTSLSVSKVFLAQRDQMFHWFTVCFGGGIGVYFLLPRDLSWFEICVLGLCCAVVLLLIASLPVISQMCATLLLAFLLGICAAGVRTLSVAAPILGWPYYGDVQGRIVAVDRSANDALRITLEQVSLGKISKARTPKRVRIALYGAIPQGVLIGRLIQTEAFLMPPQGPAEPDGFDFQRYIWFQQIGAVGYTKRDIVATGLDPPWFRLFWAQRQERFSQMIRSNMPDDTGGLAAALMSGDRSYLPKPVIEDLRRSNLAHLLAISGLHMGLLTTVVFGFVRTSLSLFWPNLVRMNAKKCAAVVALVFAAVYLMISGASISTQRSFIMVTVMLGAVLIDRQVMSLRMVSLAALIILTLRPESLFGPGFQMSFSATIALVITFKKFNSLFPHKWALIKAPVVLFISSFIAGAATAPYSAAHFNQISQLGLIANLLSVPVMSALVAPCALIAVLLSGFGLEWIGFWGVDLGLKWIISVAQYVASFDHATRSIQMPPWYFVPAFSLLMIVLLMWRGRTRFLSLPLLLMLFVQWNSGHRPDILIEGNGELVGLWSDEGRVFSKPKGAGFVADIWMENDGKVWPRTQSFQYWTDDTIRHFWSKRDAGKTVVCSEKDIIVHKIDLIIEGPCKVFDMQRLETGSIALWLNENGRIETIKTAKSENYQRLWTR